MPGSSVLDWRFVADSCGMFYREWYLEKSIGHHAVFSPINFSHGFFTYRFLPLATPGLYAHPGNPQLLRPWNSTILLCPDSEKSVELIGLINLII